MGHGILPVWLRRLLRYEKVRFVAVGALNTAVDISILFVLANLFLFPTILANVISTSTALVVSYLLNKKAVFGDTDTSSIKQVVLFVSITLVGLWVLQGAAITLLEPLLEPVLGKSGALLGAKLIATLFSLSWNYIWYSRVIFRKTKA